MWDIVKAKWKRWPSASFFPGLFLWVKLDFERVGGEQKEEEVEYYPY